MTLRIRTAEVDDILIVHNTQEIDVLMAYLDVHYGADDGSHALEFGAWPEYANGSTYEQELNTLLYTVDEITNVIYTDDE